MRLKKLKIFLRDIPLHSRLENAKAQRTRIDTLFWLAIVLTAVVLPGISGSLLVCKTYDVMRVCEVISMQDISRHECAHEDVRTMCA